MHYHWDLSMVLADPSRWWSAVGVTLLYSFATVAGGIIIGMVCGLALLSRRRWLTLPLEAYVEVFRCTPLLVQIVWFYYALPILLNFSLPAWLAAGLGLTLYMGAFCTEIFRAGVMSIGRGQWQAGRALGMTQIQLMRRIVLPQAVRRMVPPLVNQSITQLKNTALLYVVAVPDLMYTGSIVTAETYRPLEVYTSVAAMYFIILYPLTLFAKRLEVRVDQ
ncbi:MAG TPA: amino acid ABC transporter permease [Stellaceae bacterium]|jgi:polar amino acid transport system permease protein|nr:amino acid ABC transporter permease [Stellaceae bacterium]HEX3524577.1 amino acid ABC transporter permease [Stellaceae bacterium]HEX4616384.1 amino acid ABC transporter permease [Stellaceae bacterium]